MISFRNSLLLIFEHMGVVLIDTYTIEPGLVLVMAPECTKTQFSLSSMSKSYGFLSKKLVMRQHPFTWILKDQAEFLRNALGSPEGRLLSIGRIRNFD